MSKNPTLTTLDNCAISYAKPGVTKTGNTMVTGLLRQNSQEGWFQASSQFACFDSAVTAQILRIASKIDDREQAIENSGESVNDQKAGLTVSLKGYYQSRKPAEEGKPWYHSFIVTDVVLVDTSALESTVPTKPSRAKKPSA